MHGCLVSGNGPGAEVQRTARGTVRTRDALDLLRGNRLIRIRYAHHERSRSFGPAGQYDRVKGLQDLRCGVRVHIHTSLKGHALRLHQFPAALDDGFVELHVRDPVHKKPADPVLALKDRHKVAPVIELVRSSKTRRPAADDGNFFAAALGRDPWLHPAFGECRLDDEELVIVDRDRVAIHPADAGLLAQRRTYATRELREIAGLEEPRERGDGSVPGSDKSMN